jgi:hypothetical protein
MYLEPKPAGGMRRMAVLSQRDDRVWWGIAERVAETIEPRLSPRVLANRWLPTGEGRRPSGLGPALCRARRAAEKLCMESDAVIRTDVRSFYPSVTPSVAFRTLVDLDVDVEIAREVALMLDGWGSEGYAGLPIGPPGSAVVANAVLAGVDADLQRFQFLRWVDDYLIGVPAGSVSRALDRTDTSLDRLGLERSREKTSLLGGGTALTWPGTYRGR